MINGLHQLRGRAPPSCRLPQVVAAGKWSRPPTPSPARPTSSERVGLEAASRSEVVAGMQVAVKSLRREGDRLHLTYTFRWAGEPRDFVFIRPWGGINLYFWDA